MKLTFIGHASILIETRGVVILSDPWWRGPCFGAQWWNYPLPHLQSIAERRIDYIYVSHGHHDHFHPGTLGTLSKSTKVIVSTKTGLAPAIRELGLEVIGVNDDQAIPLGNGGVNCRIMETHDGDTLMALDDGTEVCVNLNDALHSAPEPVQRHFVARLNSLFPRIDYVFCGYGVASHFPNCYVIPAMDRVATAAKRQAYFNGQWAHLIAALQPRYGFPFAADVALLEDDLFWVNEAIHNCERPTEAFQRLHAEAAATVVDIGPGFQIEDGEVTADIRREPVRASNIRRACAEKILRANWYVRVGPAGVQDVAELLKKKLEISAEYLAGYEGDYRFLIRLRGSDFGIRIEKRLAALTLALVPDGSADHYDLVYTTRLAYLRWALTRPHGDEILFVGSGGVFEYADAALARRNLHRELMSLLRTGATPPVARHGNGLKLVRNAKQLLKRMLRRSDSDLYDLNEWIVFTAPGNPYASDVEAAPAVVGSKGKR